MTLDYSALVASALQYCVVSLLLSTMLFFLVHLVIDLRPHEVLKISLQQVQEIKVGKQKPDFIYAQNSGATERSARMPPADCREISCGHPYPPSSPVMENFHLDHR